MKKTAALLGVCAIALFAAEASAWAPLDGTYPRWPNMPVQYKINESTIPPSIAAFGKARLDQALAAWGEPSCTFWAVQNTGNSTASFNPNDGQSVFMWRSGQWPGQLGDVNSVIGVTMPVWDNNSAIFDADIVYNNVGFCWNDNGGNNCVDTLSIATHEDGHFLGLDHSDVSGSTMEPFYGGGNAIASIEQDDIDGVCALYPSQGSAISSAAGSGGGNNCQSCADATANSQCSSAYNACGASQQCVQYANCLNSCGSQACVDSCGIKFPQGVSIYDAYVDCVCNVCSTECSMACVGNGGSSSAAGGNGSSSGSPGTGGNGGEGGSTGAWTSDPEEPAVNPRNDSSCACSMQPSPVRFGAYLGAGALALAWMRRRKRSA